jgi:hypothetical protein
MSTRRMTTPSCPETKPSPISRREANFELLVPPNHGRAQPRRIPIAESGQTSTAVFSASMPRVPVSQLCRASVAFEQPTEALVANDSTVPRRTSAFEPFVPDPVPLNKTPSGSGRPSRHRRAASQTSHRRGGELQWRQTRGRPEGPHLLAPIQRRLN